MYQMWIQKYNEEGGSPQLSKYSSKFSKLSVINQENVNPMVLEYNYYTYIWEFFKWNNTSYIT
jgi:hypothetical protein